MYNIGNKIIKIKRRNDFSSVHSRIKYCVFLAHLSETQGEFIVYYFVRRPSVHNY